jgi:hypothetical protein
MKIYILAIASLTLAIASCKKDEPIQCELPTSPSFEVPSTAGSYWIYEWVKIDTNGIETPMNTVDTVQIIGDTVIDNNACVIYTGTSLGVPMQPSFRRDSSGYIVDQNGFVFYSYLNFTDQIRTGSTPGLWDWYTKMIDHPTEITVPVGSFKTIEHQQYFHDAQGGTITQCNQDYVTFGTWYASGVGEVKRTTTYFSAMDACSWYLEKRLVEYHIE